ncbi:BTB/POZ domain-containing protein, partial [Aspergillus saccharolyticus JOP 1030-1]
GDVITILVGKEKQALTVHECLARASSPFIDRALTAAWAEHRNRTIRLPDDEHEIVVLYVHWLYCGKLPVISDAYKVEYTQLVKAYILGDKLLSTEFQHSVIGALIERRTTFIGGRRCAPTAETVAYAYCHTIPTSPLRQLLVDIRVNSTNPTEWLSENRSLLPADFLVDLAIKLFDLR